MYISLVGRTLNAYLTPLPHIIRTTTQSITSHPRQHPIGSVTTESVSASKCLSFQEDMRGFLLFGFCFDLTSVRQR